VYLIDNRSESPTLHIAAVSKQYKDDEALVVYTDNNIYFNNFIRTDKRSFLRQEKGKPIEYANIWVEKQDIGTTSEQNGKFFLNRIS
jgi:hypothetical protein